MSNATHIFFDYKGLVLNFDVTNPVSFKKCLKYVTRSDISLSKMEIVDVVIDIDEHTIVKFISDDAYITLKEGRAALSQFSVEFANFPLNNSDNPYKLNVLPLSKKYNL